MATGTVVIDPGHGGTTTVGNSSPNNATSPSGVLEKAMTLTMAHLLRTKLLAAAGHNITVVMTRTSDVNLGLVARANVARSNSANLFVSIHYNGFNGAVRGVETLVRGVVHGNVNHAEDVAFAQRLQSRVFTAIKARDSNTVDRGVRDQQLGVLEDVALGNSSGSHPCKACLIEIEFIDVPAVDQLLNTGPNAVAVQDEIAEAMKVAIIESL